MGRGTPGPDALAYYKMFGLEPYITGLSIRVEKPEVVIPMVLDALLDKILSTWRTARPNLLIVAHGNADGLLMSLFRGSGFVARTESLKKLMTVDPAVLASATGEGESELRSLVHKMNAVRKLGVGTIAYRGCTIGSSRDALNTLRKFFGAKIVSAPDVKSNFGGITPNLRKYDRGVWERWRRRFPTTAKIYTSPEGEHFAASINPRTDSTEALTESVRATRWWIGVQFPSVTTVHHTSGRFPIHSL